MIALLILSVSATGAQQNYSRKCTCSYSLLFQRAVLPVAANCGEIGSPRSCSTHGVFAHMFVHVRKHTQPENVAMAAKPQATSLWL